MNISKILNQICKRTKSSTFKLTSESFNNLSHSHPLQLNDNIKKPMLINRNDIRAGLLVDGISGCGKHTVGGIYLTQLLSKGGGFIALINTTHDSAHALYAAAKFFGRENEITFVKESDLVTKFEGDIHEIIKNNKMLVVLSSYNKPTQVNAKSSCIDYIIEHFCFPIDNDTPPFSIYSSAEFFRGGCLNKELPKLHTAAQKVRMGRITVDSDEDVRKLKAEGNHSVHVQMRSESGVRKDLKVGQFILSYDSVSDNQNVRIARFVTIPEVKLPNNLAGYIE